jgi:hypothetical protein
MKNGVSKNVQKLATMVEMWDCFQSVNIRDTFSGEENFHFSLDDQSDL